MNDITRPVPKQLPKPAANPPAQSPKPVAGTPVPAEKPILSSELQPPQKKRVWWRWAIGIVGALLVLAALAFGVVCFMYTQALGPKSADRQNIAIDIPQGASTDHIANLLAEKGLVQSSLATKIYMQLDHDTNIKAGHYILSPSMSVAEIAKWLSDGRVDTLRVTILPGRILNELKQDLMTNYGFDAAAIDAAFTKNYDHPLLKDKPAGVNLEGYIFPETYFMESSSTPEDIVLRSFDEFQAQLDKAGMVEKLAAKGFNIHQGITLASIINAEVSGAEDHRKVAQVFEKRLQEGMPLGSDVTYIYAAGQMGVPATPSLDSPYNTRQVLGLPPGAIQNFNFAALEAVVNPANTSYLYFVAGDDGITRYAYTVEEHEANVAKYCQKACFQ